MCLSLNASKQVLCIPQYYLCMFIVKALFMGNIHYIYTEMMPYSVLLYALKYGELIRGIYSLHIVRAYYSHAL